MAIPPNHLFATLKDNVGHDFARASGDGCRIARHGGGMKAGKPPAKRGGKTTPAPLASVELERRPARLSASMAALAAALLKKPRRTVGGLGRAVGELARIVRGTSSVAPAPGDRRFDDPAWRESALYRRMNGRIVASRLRRATLESLACGHLFMLTRPGETARRVERFMAEHPVRRTRSAD